MIYMTFLGGAFGPPSCCFSCRKGPKHPLKKSCRSYFRRAQIRWVIWPSSNYRLGKTALIKEVRVFKEGGIATQPALWRYRAAGGYRSYSIAKSRFNGPPDAEDLRFISAPAKRGRWGGGRWKIEPGFFRGFPLAGTWVVRPRPVTTSPDPQLSAYSPHFPTGFFRVLTGIFSLKKNIKKTWKNSPTPSMADPPLAVPDHSTADSQRLPLPGVIKGRGLPPCLPLF